ncbi:LIC_13387 family protein [Profundibacter sp.]|uniref:LIC_13387 family protein n=1 Tax=Profundibacter sp. TaxID=3101071 RepID=UPI003D11AB23
MKLIRYIYLAGCWLFGIFCGVGHTIFELGPKTPETLKLMETIRGFHVSVPGTQTNAYTLTLGVSLIMGLMLVAYGVANLLILRDTPTPELPKTGYLLMNVLFSGAAFILAWKYLFLIPIAFTGLAVLCFVISLGTALLRTMPPALALTKARK